LRSLNTYREGGFGRRWLLRCAIAGIAVVCFAVSACALDPARAVPQYLYDSWGTERGWPGGSITAIAQSSDGYLWIGTDKGLVRFDGMNFQQFQLAHPDPIWIGPVRTLVVDASDNLWILLQNTLVFRYHNGDFELIRGETESGTTAMARGTSGAVLLSSLAEGTLTYTDNRFRSLSSAALPTDTAKVANGEAADQRATSFSWFDRLAAPTSVAISMAQTEDGKIWLGTEHQGLFYLHEGRVSSASNGRDDTKITCLLPLRNSELWVGTPEGVLRWNGTKLSLAGVPSSLLNLDVLSILRDRDVNIWVGTSRGLFRYNANGVSLLSTTGPVAALFEDREGNIWIGGAHGLDRLRDTAFVTYSLPDLKSQGMGPLHVDSGGRTWIAPIQGGLRWLKEGQSGVVTVDGIANDVVYSIAGTGNDKDKDKDDVWVGRQQGGLTHLLYSGNSFTAKTYTQADGLAQNRVYAVYRSRDGTIWSGTLSRGVSELKNGHFTNYTTADGLAANTISSIAEGLDGTMWFGTPRGVSAMSQKGWRTYTSNNGLPSEDVNCLLQDSTRILWIGTAEGLAYLTDGQLHVPRAAPESLHAQIFGIEEDKNGWLWIATSDHVLRVPRDKLLSGVVTAADVREYDQADGLDSTEGVKRSRSVVSDSAGRIWFSLSSGLSVVNPSQIRDNSVPALPHIEALTADNNTANLAASVRIPPSPRRITFEYTGLSLAVPGRIRFRYFLEGFDSGWSQPVAAREAVYTNLGPGSYRFRLVASNSEGLWNGPETAIVFIVAPAYYQTYWFRLSCIAVFIALLWALHRWRVHQLKNQEERLREAVETIPALTFTTLPDGSNTFVNKRWTEYTGLSVESTSGIGWQRAIHPEDLVRHSEKWRNSVATGLVFEDEARFRRSADGEYRWFLVRGVPLRDQHSSIVRWYGTLTDIEDRKRAEESLQQSQFYLVEGQRLAHMGSWAYNPTGFFEYWSQELFKIYGLDPQKGAPTLEEYLAILHPQDRDVMADTIRRMRAECSGCDVTKRIVRPDGEQRYIRCVGIPVVQGEVLKGFLGTAIDVTEQEMLTQELERRQAYLAEAQRLSHTGSWAWTTANGEMRYLSEECYRVLGFDPHGGQPRFRALFLRIHPDDQVNVWEALQKTKVEKAEFELDYRILHPGGDIRDIHLVGHPVLSPSGAIVEFVGTMMDVTERKRAEALRDGESRILEMIARDSPLQEILENLVRVVEAQFAGLLCSVLLLDEDGQHVRHAAAPSLPEPYIAAIEGLSIGPNAGSCGTAMYRSEPVIVTDILQDPLWESYRAMAEPHGLRACWSTPILAHSGKVLGSFAMYYREPRSPSPSENRALEMATHLAGIAIERKLTRERLQRSEAYLAEAQKLTHTASWAWRSPDRKVVHLSEEFYRIYGFDSAEGVPTWEEYFERVHPEDRIRWKTTIERAMVEKAEYDLEFRILLPNGMVKWIHTVGHPVLSDAGDLEQFVGSSSDITERKHAEEAVRSSEAYLVEAQSLTHTGSCAIDGTTRETVYWSDEMFRLFGFDPQQGLPMFDQWLQRIHPEDFDKVKLASERAFLTKVNCDVEFRIVKPDGTVKHIHGVGHPVLSATGELVQVLGTMVDVTERKRAEEAGDKLRQLEADLAHIDRVSTLGEMAASLAHEIKQPIAAAITSANSCVEWLAHEPPNLDRARAAAARIDKYGNRAAEIIDRIRSFYKKSPPQRELVDVNGIIQEMLTLLKGEATRCSIMMRTELAAELPQIMADRVQLQQVFMNLMLNGIEAMENAGGELAVKSQLQDGQLQFSVSDTGVGLPSEQMDKIFSAFFTTKPQGSGMGLAISRSIVESHGGQLWATANDGHGAAFHFTLPTHVTESALII